MVLQGEILVADTHLVVMVMTVILQLGVPVVEVAHLLHLVVAVGVAELEPMVACQEVTLTGMVLAAAAAAASTEITPV
ncbi:hypothetical protein [Kluyvera cryocrescens]|nr:hypothetical protein [Kluyvera cryocrescens]